MLRILGGLLVAALLVFVVGYFAGWIELEGTSYAGGEDVTVRLDKRELDEDVDDLGQGARDLAKDVGRAFDDDPDDDVLDDPVEDVPAEARAAAGRIEQIDAVAGLVVLELDDGTPLSLTVDESTVVRRDGNASSLAALQVDDRVDVRYTTPEAGRPLARIIDLRAR